MSAPRKKAVAQEAPSTLAEAIGLIGTYGGLVQEIARLGLDADTAIATIEAARDEAIKPLEVYANDIFKRLRAWWAVAGDAVTDGKRKSAEIAGWLLGIRTTTPSLKLPKGAKVDEVVALVLNGEGGLAFISTKHSLDKPSIIKALRALGEGREHPLFSPIGLTVSQREEFFIDRAAPKAPDPEVIETEGAEA